MRVKGEGVIQVRLAAVSREEKFEPADSMPARMQAKVHDSSVNDVFWREIERAKEGTFRGRVS